jgi:hypothetical protein
MELARPRKPYVQRDRRYVVEFVDQHYPHDKAFFNLRMGPPPIAVAEAYPGLDVDRYARVYKKTCDAVVVAEDEIILIEGELRRPVEGLGELLVYRDLIATTPELKPYLPRKLRTILVCPLVDPTMSLQLRERDVELAIFRPKWVEDYLKEVMR